MAHFAEINQENIVERVIVVGNAECLDADGIESEAVAQAFIASLGLAGQWVQTSYNNNIRKRYAGIGYRWDAVRDEFVPPDWTLIDDVWTPPPAPEPAS